MYDLWSTWSRHDSWRRAQYVKANFSTMSSLSICRIIYSKFDISCSLFISHPSNHPSSIHPSIHPAIHMFLTPLGFLIMERGGLYPRTCSWTMRWLTCDVFVVHVDCEGLGCDVFFQSNQISTASKSPVRPDLCLTVWILPWRNMLCCVIQVDYVLKEATSLENLAVLYEGWTPWVWPHAATTPPR